MKTNHDLSSVLDVGLLGNLIDAIAAGSFDSQEKGPVVVAIKLGDGRVVQGTYHRCLEDELDVVNHKGDIIMDDEALKPFVSALLKDGTPFVTETGSHDTVCTLRWTIR